ncbi:atherin-like [Neofelis nebulosa]|uniref:atherin-like n=1 Tax=Neofelis nebulosa TaxID=61452 RepID=UPI00272A4987|nr:atherin-like [Neofelis nebulosa]
MAPGPGAPGAPQLGDPHLEAPAPDRENQTREHPHQGASQTPAGHLHLGGTRTWGHPHQQAGGGAVPSRRRRGSAQGPPGPPWRARASIPASASPRGRRNDPRPPPGPHSPHALPTNGRRVGIWAAAAQRRPPPLEETRQACRPPALTAPPAPAKDAAAAAQQLPPGATQPPAPTSAAAGAGALGRSRAARAASPPPPTHVTRAGQWQPEAAWDAAAERGKAAGCRLPARLGGRRQREGKAGPGFGQPVPAGRGAGTWAPPPSYPAPTAATGPRVSQGARTCSPSAWRMGFACV